MGRSRVDSSPCSEPPKTETHADPPLHRPPDRQEARRLAGRAARARLRARHVAGHGEPAGRPQRELQCQAGQGLGAVPRGVRRLPVQRLAEGLPGWRARLHRLQPPGRGAAAEADGRIQPVHRRPRAFRPLPAGHDRLPGHRPAAPQRRRDGDRGPGRGPGQASGPGPVAPGGAHQYFRVAQQPPLQAVHLVHPRQEWQEGLGLLPRLHWLPGRRGRAERDARPAQGLQRLRRERGPAGRTTRWSTTPPARPRSASRWAWRNSPA